MGNICSSIYLTLCMLGQFACFFVSADFFKKKTFSIKSFMNTIRELNSLDPGQVRFFVGPGLRIKLFSKLISRWQVITRGENGWYSVYQAT